MKYLELIAVCLTLGLANGAIPQDQYTRVCTPPTTHDAALDADHSVTYYCDQKAPSTRRYRAVDAASPEACIRACAAIVGNSCMGSFWSTYAGLSKPCFLYETVPLSDTVLNGVYMTYGGDESDGDDLVDDDDEGIDEGDDLVDGAPVNNGGQSLGGDEGDELIDAPPVNNGGQSQAGDEGDELIN